MEEYMKRLEAAAAQKQREEEEEEADRKRRAAQPLLKETAFDRRKVSLLGVIALCLALSWPPCGSLARCSPTPVRFLHRDVKHVGLHLAGGVGCT
jgi:hypothetical protein